MHSVQVAREELPMIIHGEIVVPRSGLGSEAGENHERQAPVAVIVGAGFSEDEVKEMRQIDNADRVPWFHGNPDLVDLSQFEGGIPPTSSIAKRCKVVLARQQIAPGNGINRAEAGIFQF